MTVAFNPNNNNKFGQGGYGGGGGIPGGGTGQAPTFVPFLENGGFQATAFYLFVPSQNNEGGNSYIATFSPNNWNDTVNGGFYAYRQEDIVVGRYPTVRRLIVIYRDLGVATFTGTVMGTNDNQQVVMQSQTVTIGTPTPMGTIFQVFLDISVSCFRPQVIISRTAGSGPLSIISVTMIGEVEETSL
jgi:hypothetical protein